MNYIGKHIDGIIKWQCLIDIVYAEDDEVTHGQVSPVERMDHKGLIPKVDDTGNL